MWLSRRGRGPLRSPSPPTGHLASRFRYTLMSGLRVSSPWGWQGPAANRLPWCARRVALPPTTCQLWSRHSTPACRSSPSLLIAHPNFRVVVPLKPSIKVDSTAPTSAGSIRQTSSAPKLPKRWFALRPSPLSDHSHRCLGPCISTVRSGNRLKLLSWTRHRSPCCRRQQQLARLIRKTSQRSEHFCYGRRA